MFKKIILLCAVCVTVLSSCSKSESDVPAAGASASVVGKWTLTGVTANIDTKTINATANALKVNEIANAVYEFKADNTGSLGGEPIKYTFDAAKNALTIIYDATYKETYTTAISGSTLKLSSIKAEIEPKVEYTEDSPEFEVLFAFLFLFEDQETELVKLGVDDAKTIQMVYNLKK
jgi:hypothetical protein